MIQFSVIIFFRSLHFGHFPLLVSLHSLFKLAQHCDETVDTVININNKENGIPYNTDSP